MISGGRAKLAAAAGLILVFVAVLVYMRLFPGQESPRMVSLAFIVMGIALPVAGYIRVEDAGAGRVGPGTRTGLYSLFLVYGLSAVSMAILLTLLDAGASLIATLEIALAMVFGVIYIFAAVIGGDRARRGAQAMDAVAFMRALEEDVYHISQEDGNKEHRERLRKIGEAIRFSDHSGATDIDAELADKIRELKYALREAAESDPGARAESASGVSAESASGASAEDLSSHRLDKQVDLITEDILRLIQNRNRKLLNEKKARSLSHG